MRRFFGGLLLAVGILLMTGSGLCTLAVFLMMFSGGGGQASMGILPLIVGGIPFGTGVGLFLLGRRLLRRPEYPELDDVADRFR